MKLIYKHTDGKNFIDVYRLYPDKDDYIFRVNGKTAMRFNCDNESGIVPALPSLVDRWLDFNSKDKFKGFPRSVK